MREKGTHINDYFDLKEKKRVQVDIINTDEASIIYVFLLISKMYKTLWGM